MDMSQFNPANFAERLSAAAEARKAQLARFKPKAAAPAAEFVSREARLEAEREAVREARKAEKEAAKVAKAEAAEAERQRLLLDEEAQLEIKRNERRERKSAQKTDAQARRAARLAAYGKAPVNV
jgi:hypothetical protein